MVASPTGGAHDQPKPRRGRGARVRSRSVQGRAVQPRPDQREEGQGDRRTADQRQGREDAGPLGAEKSFARLFDAAKLGAALGNKEVALADKSQSDADAASVCQVKLAGTPPSDEEQKKMWIKNNRVLGMLPGDEICQVTVYCGFTLPPRRRRRSAGPGVKVSDDVGEVTCVESFEAGADYRYVFGADSDTRCSSRSTPDPASSTRPRPSCA